MGLRVLRTIGQTHEVRATFWTVGSLILIFMAARTLLAALGF